MCIPWPAQSQGKRCLLPCTRHRVAGAFDLRSRRHLDASYLRPGQVGRRATNVEIELKNFICHMTFITGE